MARTAPPASAYIESVVVDRKPFAPRDQLSISPHPRDLQIDYTSPVFVVPQRVTFRYRLDGYDQDWHDVGTRRQAFYTDLPPGKYSFRVIASNSDGVWSDRAAMLNLFVAPAYDQTNWFRMLVLLTAVALVWAAYRWRVRQLRHAFQMTLDARVGERTRIARELHDTLLQSFHALVLRFQTVLNLLPDRPEDARQRLEAALERADEAITEGRNAVQGLRNSTVEKNDLALALRSLGEDLSNEVSVDRPAAFTVTLDGDSRALHPIVRDEIYNIAAEAIRNAFRHAGADRIEVDVRYDARQLRLVVRDDGKGVDPAVLAAMSSQGHYGLRGMRERAGVIGGRLVVWSEPGEGTEVELRVPTRVAPVGAQTGI